MSANAASAVFASRGKASPAMYLTFQKTLTGGQPTADYITVNTEAVHTLEIARPLQQHNGSAYRVQLTFGPGEVLYVYLASSEQGADVAEDRMAQLRGTLSNGVGYVNWSSMDDAAPTVA